MQRDFVERLIRGMAALAATWMITFVVAPATPAFAEGNEAPGNPAAFRAMSARSNGACVILTNGSVRCWGYNSAGRLGLGDANTRGDAINEMGAFLPAVNLGTGRTAIALAVGGVHTCALLDNNTVKCWGAGPNGRLGQGDTSNRGDGPGEMGDSLPAVNLGTGRTALAVTAGSGHTCALLDNNTVKCWGANNLGQLGLGDTASRGDGAGEMGDALPTVNLGTGRTATAVTAGGSDTCALLDNNTVKCWGANTQGQLGQGDTVARGDAPGEMGDALSAVNLGTGRTATALSASGSHTCALLDNNTVKCWGVNGSGQLGQGDTATRGDGPGEMGDNLPAVNLGIGRTANAVTAGSSHTCARLDNNTVKCWGFNSVGQLGLGDPNNRGENAGEMGDNLPAVNLGAGRTATAISAGIAHTCATLDNGTRKCWGLNDLGQLGQEDLADRGDGPGEMGDNLPAIFLPPAGFISGTVTDSVTAQPISTAVVAVLRSSDFGLAASAITDSVGNYTTHAPPGSYLLYLLDATAAHVDGFFGAPLTVFVADGGNSDTDPTMAPKRGSFSGTLTDQATGSVLPSVSVFAIGTNGVAAGTTTASNGTYTIANLPIGNYHAVFIDGLGRRTAEYYNNSPDFAGSTPIAVTVGTNTPNINATLFRP